MSSPISKLVDKAIALDRQRREIEKELEEVETQIITHATENRKEDGEATDGGGWTVDVVGASGEVAKVVQAGPSMKSFKDESKDLLALRQVLGATFKELYRPELAYKPVDNIRDAAKALLDTPTRRQFTKLAQKAGSLRVAYNTKKTATK